MRKFSRKFSRFSNIFLLIFVSLLQSAVSPASEKEILLEFKGNISEDPLNILKSWDPSPSQNPCQNFNGIVCNYDGNVQKIILQKANLAGVLSSSLSGLKSLEILSLCGNRFSGSIPAEFAEIRTLRKLNLSENALSGRIPEFLGGLESLRFLDLSKNMFTGEIPSSLFENCFRTMFVSLSHNNLLGTIPPSLANCLMLVGLDFSFNNLTGDFPVESCASRKMAYISLRRNSLAGEIPELISTCQSLEFLDIASNAFTGSLPFNLLRLQNLSFFNASSNRFHGEIPEISTCGDQMKMLDISRNDLHGEICPSIANCRSIRLLNFGFNRLNGSIPAEIGNLKSLSIVSLGNNAIEGRIPEALGSIEFLLVLDLQNLRLSGEIPAALSNCRFLLQLDLSGNNLQGEIPRTLQNMTYLKFLDLHRNQLNGSIPSSLGNLSHIRFLDLSENLLTGSIPSSLENLAQLTYFNLSCNDLSGTIPNVTAIQQFGPTAFTHNPALCGEPLDTLCSVNFINATTSETRRTKLLSVSAIIFIVVAALILIGVGLITVINAKTRWRDNEALALEGIPDSLTGSNLILGKLVLFSKSFPTKYEDWERGTKALFDMDYLIGGGSIGTVYRTSFECGISIAVKKLETLGRIRNQDEFEQEIDQLRNLRHPNLVAFKGYYWSSSMQLILSELVPNGNLYQHLHGSSYSAHSSSSHRRALYWSRRFRIALGVARALAYLHYDCKPQILHLNIKSSNILLDEGYEAKLSDYGLGSFLPMFNSCALTKFHGAAGYVAPELIGQSLGFSDKCDVYSFGVILLELVTGRKPVERLTATEVVVLCDYVRQGLEKGKASYCFDRSLCGFSGIELVQVMKLGLICTSKAPSKRPSMAEVVQVLESIEPGP